MHLLDSTQLINSPAVFIGALDFDQRPQGISPRRLPAWTRSQLPRMMDVMARMPSGVRLAFVTDSTRIQLTALTTNMVTPPDSPRTVIFDLEIDGEIASVGDTAGNHILLDPSDPENFQLMRGDTFVAQFENLGSERKFCQLWLPHNALVEVRSLGLDEGACLEAPPEITNRWIHYGSSISHCLEAEQPTGTWPAVAANKVGMSLFSLGFAGQCHLDQFVARTIRDMDADVISIKTGINVVNMDSMRERTFVPALHGFLDTIREGKPDTPIVIASPIFCPSAEHRPGPTIANAEGRFVTLPGHDEIQAGCLTLTRIRKLIEELVEARRASDPHLGYINGLELFSEADADDLPDDLHPNPEGYRRMGERFASQVFGAGGLLADLRG